MLILYSIYVTCAFCASPKEQNRMCELCIYTQLTVVCWNNKTTPLGLVTNNIHHISMWLFIELEYINPQSIVTSMSIKGGKDVD